MEENKYAMVCINFRRTGADKKLIRRVLIQYDKYEDYIFSGTRFITKDPYFDGLEESHRYSFEDDGYTLLASNNEETSEMFLGTKRAYHSAGQLSEDLQPILFTAEDEGKAITTFYERKEDR